MLRSTYVAKNEKIVIEFTERRPSQQRVKWRWHKWHSQSLSAYEASNEAANETEGCDDEGNDSGDDELVALVLVEIVGQRYASHGSVHCQCGARVRLR